MAEAPSFANLVPGFDFLQNLVKNAGAALPSIGQWVAPTLDPEELEKRIGELRTVQFWLEQNVRMLEATIQALEVQRMTLSTLKTMNVQMEDLRDSLQIRLPDTVKSSIAPAQTPTRSASVGADADTDENAAPEDKSQPAPEPAKKRAKPPARHAALAASAPAPATPHPIDPMQWWGALTKQFTELAANALKDSTVDATRSLAAQAMKQSIEAAAGAMKPAETKSSGADDAAPARAPRKRAAPKR